MRTRNLSLTACLLALAALTSAEAGRPFPGVALSVSIGGGAVPVVVPGVPPAVVVAPPPPPVVVLPPPGCGPVPVAVAGPPVGVPVLVGVPVYPGPQFGFRRFHHRGPAGWSGAPRCR